MQDVLYNLAEWDRSAVISAHSIWEDKIAEQDEAQETKNSYASDGTIIDKNKTKPDTLIGSTARMALKFDAFEYTPAELGPVESFSNRIQSYRNGRKNKKQANAYAEILLRTGWPALAASNEALYGENAPNTGKEINLPGRGNKLPFYTMPHISSDNPRAMNSFLQKNNYVNFILKIKQKE